MTMPRRFSMKETAERIGRSYRHTLTLCDEGKLPHDTDATGHRTCTQADIDHFLSGGRVASRSQQQYARESYRLFREAMYGKAVGA